MATESEAANYLGSLGVSKRGESPARRIVPGAAGGVTGGSPGVGEERDEVLMLRFAEGDLVAFEELLHRHRSGVYRFVFHFTGNREEAEDVVQETFMRVIRSRARYKATAKFTTWLYRIARNLCIDAQRRKNYRNEQSLESSGDEEDSSMRDAVDPGSLGMPQPHRSALAEEIGFLIEDLVTQLPEPQREVFLMRQELGLGFEEISLIVRCPKNTAKSRMRYALEYLRTRLQELGINAEAFE